jgi:hypothetical protein
MPLATLAAAPHYTIAHLSQGAQEGVRMVFWGSLRGFPLIQCQENHPDAFLRRRSQAWITFEPARTTKIA